jgi:hypothetical protein
MLQKEDILKIKKNDIVFINYKLKLPKHIIERQFSNPLIDQRLKPIEFSLECDVISNGTKKIKLKSNDGRLFEYEHSDFNLMGIRGVDSQFYMFLSKTAEFP